VLGGAIFTVKFNKNCCWWRHMKMSADIYVKIFQEIKILGNINNFLELGSYLSTFKAMLLHDVLNYSDQGRRQRSLL
jgi:hypothetical protein